MSETELDPPSGAPQRLIVLGGVAAVLVSVVVGVGVAVFAGGDDEQTAAVPRAEAPQAPGTFALGDESPSGVAATDDAAPSESSVNADSTLKLARRLEGAGEESAAIEVLDDFLRGQGDIPAVVEARNDLFARCDELLQHEADRIRKLRRLGQDDLIAEKIEGLRKRLPTALHPELDMLEQTSQVIEVAAAVPEAPAAPSQAQLDAEESNPNLVTFNRLVRNLAAQQNPEAHFKLGAWAKENGLYKRANQCFEKAIALDGFHEGARKALGHGFHEGRWYEPDAYRRDVLGLVKDAKGKWVKPQAMAARTRVKKVPRGAVVPKPKTKRLVPPPPPTGRKEDTAWYSDNESVCSFEDAPEYKSKYYLIRTNVKPEYAERYGKMLDQYFKRFVKVFKAFLPNKRYERCEINIYATRKAFQSSNPNMPPTAGGFYSTRTKEVTGYHGKFGQTGNTRTVLVHEGTHQFEDLVLKGNFRNAPIWIIEGLAVFFESAYYRNGEIRIGLVPRERLYALKRGLASNSLIPLSQLIRTPQARFTGYHYAHAWSLIYMVLYYGDSPKIRKRCQKWFSDLFAAALTKRVTPRDVENGVGGKAEFKELEVKWKAWLRELPYDYDPKKH